MPRLGGGGAPTTVAMAPGVPKAHTHFSEGSRAGGASTTLSSRKQEIRELVQACPPYTESFNHAIKIQTSAHRARSFVALETEGGGGCLIANSGSSGGVEVNSLEEDDLNLFFVRCVLDRMKGDGIPLNTETYNLLIQSVMHCADEMVFHISEEFKAVAMRPGATVRPTRETFNMLFRACERRAQYHRAFRMYVNMKNDLQLLPDRAMFNTLISFCAAVHDEAQATYFVEEMKKHGVDPDVNTYNCLLFVYSEAPYPEILRIFHELRRSVGVVNVRSYNAVLSAALREDDYDRAFQLFEEMKQEGVVPNVVTYNTLLRLCERRLDYVLGRGKYASLVRTNEQCEQGKGVVAELAMALFRDLTDSLVRPNTYTYNALLSVLSRCADGRVYAIFDRMRVASAEYAASGDAVAACQRPPGAPQGASPSPSLDKSIGAENRAESCLINALGVQTNVDTYRIMVDAVIHQCHYHEGRYSSRQRATLLQRAVQLYDDLLAEGLPLDGDIYTAFFRVCTLARGELSEFADRVFTSANESAARLDIGAFNAFLECLAAAGDPEILSWLQHVCSVGDKREWGLQPNTETFNFAIRGFGRSGDVTGALMIFDRMRERLPPCQLRASFKDILPALDSTADTKDGVTNPLLARHQQLAKMLNAVEPPAPDEATFTEVLCLAIDTVVREIDAARQRLVQSGRVALEAPPVGLLEDKLTHRVGSCDRDEVLTCPRAKLVRAVEATVAEMREWRVPTGITTSNELLRAYAVAGNRDQVLQLFHTLTTEAAVVPQVIGQTALRTASLSMDSALQTFPAGAATSMPAGTVAAANPGNPQLTVTPAGNTFLTASNVSADKTAELLWSQADNAKPKIVSPPRVQHVASASSATANLDTYVIALEFFAETDEKNFHSIFDALKSHMTLEPDIRCYLIALRLMWRTKQPGQAMSLFDQIRMRTLRPTIDVYNVLIETVGCLESSAVQDVLRDMKRNDIQVTGETLGILLKTSPGRKHLMEAVERGLIAVERLRKK